jgi:hypothetical protein
MTRPLEPIIGQWYHDHGEQRMFEVIGLDEDERHIRVQCADGDVLALSNDSWRDLLLSMAAPPPLGSSGSDNENDEVGDNRSWSGEDWHGHLDDLGSIDD